VGLCWWRLRWGDVVGICSDYFVEYVRVVGRALATFVFTADMIMLTLRSIRDRNILSKFIFIEETNIKFVIDNEAMHLNFPSHASTMVNGDYSTLIGTQPSGICRYVHTWLLL
jgi:hypothetical protein